MTGGKLHDNEVASDAELVRRLVAAQFPQWRDLAVVPLASTGTDNAIYRLGDDLVVRLPRIEWAVSQSTKELEWLPHLAPLLPVELAEPVAVGQPGEGYPWTWLVSRWLTGDTLLERPAVDESALADDLAGFVRALQAVDVASPIAAGKRGGPLAAHDAFTRWSLDQLTDEIDVDAARRIWDDALAAPAWDRSPVWLHGDLLPGNVLLVDGRLRGIIDWNSAGVGDPACDLMIGWSLGVEARAAYFTALDIDEATWRRGRGWALSQAAQFIPYYRHTIPDGVAAARTRLEAILAE